MKKPILVCAADLAHLPEVKDLLESNFELRMARPATAKTCYKIHPNIKLL